MQMSHHLETFDLVEDEPLAPRYSFEVWNENIQSSQSNISPSQSPNHSFSETTPTRNRIGLATSILRPRIFNRRSPSTDEAGSTIMSSPGAEENTSPLVPNEGLSELIGDEEPSSTNERAEVKTTSPCIAEAGSTILSSSGAEANASPLVPRRLFSELIGDANSSSDANDDEVSPSSQDNRSSFQDQCASPITLTRNSVRSPFLNIRPRINGRRIPPDEADSIDFMILSSHDGNTSSPVSIATQWFQ